MNETILVVEDDEAIREMLQEVLELEEFQVHTAVNGSKGLESFATTRPGLVLLDLMMPVMDGFAFLKELERRGMRRDAAVVALSADPTLQAKAERLGVEGFLGKPVDIENVLAEIQRLMAARRSRASRYEMPADGNGTMDARSRAAQREASREIAAVLEQAGAHLCRAVSARGAADEVSGSRPALRTRAGECVAFETYRAIAEENRRMARELQRQAAEARRKAQESRRITERLRERLAAYHDMLNVGTRTRAPTKRYVVRRA